MALNILIVGAGAVGQVFAHHLSKSGARVAFLVKPTHVLGDQLRLFPQGRGAETLSGFRRMTLLKAVAYERWDQVWLAVPSNVLTGEWISQLLTATRGSSVVALAPESNRSIPQERLVLGAIPFMAWQQPLPGSANPAGVAYWVPPLAKVPVSGPAGRVLPVLAALRAGGLPAQRVHDAAQTGAPVTALLVPMVAALELAGWSLGSFRGRWPALAAACATEAFQISSARGPLRWAARGWVFRLLLWGIARAAPFDFEQYVRFHFTKVGEQTRVLLRHWIEQGKAKGLRSAALEQLALELPRKELA